MPVIRIFGTSSQGFKTCMHVHGVFPYFYVPYDQKAFEPLTLAQVIYQVATQLDKAINVSLGQSNSQHQHVFKIQPVKGM